MSISSLQFRLQHSSENPMARPYWSGQIQISLVSFGVKLFPATEAKSEIRFHQLSRKTGERIKHQKVSGDEGPVEKSDIVKGYEYRKGEYISIEPEEIENLRIPSRHNLVVSQFVDADELDPAFFEKPYFVVPEDDVQAEAFAVVRKALQTTKKVALGKIAFGGREHLVAISATADDNLAGMMAYTMRYAEELRNPAAYFADIKKVAVDEDQLSLAEELIKRKAAKFAPEKFTDEYEAALREMVKAKVEHAPIARGEPAPKSAKVINLMDALRKSIQGNGAAETKKKATTKSADAKEGIVLIKKGPQSESSPATAKSTRSRRKSA
jgi:DNA end-binding protein Ku